MKQKNYAKGLITDHSVILEHLLSVKNTTIMGYTNKRGTHVVCIQRTLTTDLLRCSRCGERAGIHGWRSVDLIDLPCMNRPLILRWYKQRLRCCNPQCALTWTVHDPHIASQRCRLTTRAARWCVQQVIDGRMISHIARTLHCDWHTVERAVNLYGHALLKADTKRVRSTRVIGLDETTFLSYQANKFHGTRYVTTICNIEHHTIIDIAPSRDQYDVAHLLARQPLAWRNAIEYDTLDLSALYRAVLRIALPHAHLGADPFPVVKQANEQLDRVRRRVLGK